MVPSSSELVSVTSSCFRRLLSCLLLLPCDERAVVSLSVRVVQFWSTR